MSGNKKLFLSAVSGEFISYRNLLAGDLKRPNLDVAVQEDFIVTGGSTLQKLDTYILHCDAVIHLLGKPPGANADGRRENAKCPATRAHKPNRCWMPGRLMGASPDTHRG